MFRKCGDLRQIELLYHTSENRGNAGVPIGQVVTTRSVVTTAMRLLRRSAAGPAYRDRGRAIDCATGTRCQHALPTQDGFHLPEDPGNVMGRGGS